MALALDGERTDERVGALELVKQRDPGFCALGRLSERVGIAYDDHAMPARDRSTLTRCGSCRKPMAPAALERTRLTTTTSASSL